MGLLANYPIALAPAMGHNFFFAFTVCGVMGFTWQQALAANLLAGVLFLAVAPFGLREAVMAAIPDPLKHAIAAGIGLLIARIGLQWGGLIVDDPATFVALGNLGQPVPLLTLFGLCVISVLMVRRVPAAVLLGMLISVVVGWLASRTLGLTPALVELRGIVGAPPSPVATAFHLDFAGLFGLPVSSWLSVLLVFLVLDLFDTAGTLIGVAQRAGLLQANGRLARAGGAFAADAAGTVTGALLGTSTVTSYVESAAGVAAGGRTGLTAIVTGTLLLLSLFFAPLIASVGGGVEVAEGFRFYPVIAPVLILIGALMLGAVKTLDWQDPVAAIPAFLTMLIMLMSLSITDGIAWGMMAYSLLTVAARRRAPLLVHVFAVMFVVRELWKLWS
jgi:AGZA family xanthine/uracil permease-like MFS transporter